jgi:hypothetical protein
MSFNFGTGRSTLPNLPNNSMNLSKLPPQGQMGGGNLFTQGIFTPNTAFRQQPTRPSLRDVLGGARTLVQDNRRFGDLLAGASILGGTSPADALAVRETLAPTTTTTDKIGKLFNVRNVVTGQLTGEQVSETQTARIQEIQANDELSLELVGEFNPEMETNKPEKGFVRVNEDGVPRDYAIEGSQAFNQVKEDIEKSRGVYQQATSEIEKAAKNEVVILNMLNNPPKSVIAAYKLINVEPPFNGGIPFATYLATGVAGARSVENAINNLKINNFIQTLQTMRDNSKTGGAVGQVSNLELTQFQQANSPLDVRAADFRQRVIQNVDQIVRKAEEVQARALRDIETSNMQLFEKNRVEFKPQTIQDTVDRGE